MKAGDQRSRSLRERREREAVDAHYERIAVARGILPPRSRLLFFFKPRAYVLLLEDEPGVFDVARIAVEGWEGKLALCFMSPLDALIEGARIGKPGLRYDIAWAAAIGHNPFRTADGSAAAALHVSWMGEANRLLLTQEGEPVHICKVLEMDSAAEARKPGEFGVDADTHRDVEHAV